MNLLEENSIIMKKLILFLILIFSNQFIYSQVGINTTTPTAELDINTSALNLPALNIEPQSTPTGTATGQIAVIGDQLYMYDATRAKWLSTDAIPLIFSRSGDVTGTQNLRLAGNATSVNSGLLMPYNGTVVAITTNSNVSSNTTTNNLSTPFNIRIREEDNTVAGGEINFNLLAGKYIDTTINLDFVIGNHITARTSNTGTDSINNPVVTVWIKWRAN